MDVLLACWIIITREDVSRLSLSLSRFCVGGVAARQRLPGAREARARGLFWPPVPRPSLRKQRTPGCQKNGVLPPYPWPTRPYLARSSRQQCVPESIQTSLCHHTHQQIDIITVLYACHGCVRSRYCRLTYCTHTALSSDIPDLGGSISSTVCLCLCVCVYYCRT